MKKNNLKKEFARYLKARKIKNPTISTLYNWYSVNYKNAMTLTEKDTKKLEKVWAGFGR